MSRAQRLLDLMQLLRRYRYPVAGSELASKLGISLRTLYRDIATLQAQGAHIDGEAGIGYLLRPGFMLPPLMFTEDELEALALGSRWVADRGDARLGDAARQAISKIAAVLPDDLRFRLDSAALIVGPGVKAEGDPEQLLPIRLAIRRETKLVLHYRDQHGQASERVIWPFALAFFDRTQVVVGWCELRQGFRHFRTDRIVSLHETGERYPQRRQALLKAWQAEEGVPPQ